MDWVKRNIREWYEVQVGAWPSADGVKYIVVLGRTVRLGNEGLELEAGTAS